MHAVARGLLGPGEDSADAVQDALLAAYRSISSFRGIAKLWTWLYRVLVNACLSIRRSVMPFVRPLLQGHSPPQKRRGHALTWGGRASWPTVHTGGTAQGAGEPAHAWTRSIHPWHRHQPAHAPANK